MSKLTLSPVPHVNGPLSLVLEIEQGRVVEAHIGALSHRRLESVARGYHVRDLPQIARRVSAQASFGHSHAAMLAVEDFADIQPDGYTQAVRNLLLALELVRTHINQFYEVYLDKIFSLPRIRDYEGNEQALIEMRNRIKYLDMIEDTAPYFLKSDSDPWLIYDTSRVVAAWINRFRAQSIAKLIGRCAALLEGRSPHGVADRPGNFINKLRFPEFERIRESLSEIKLFIDKAYMEDMLVIATGPLAGLHQEKIGYGVGNFMTFGMFDLGRNDGQRTGTKRLIPAGIVFSTDWKDTQSVNVKKITEELKYSWFQRVDGGMVEIDLEKRQAYSFIKAARYQGSPVETGPLARMMVSSDRGFMAILDLIGPWPSFLTRLIAGAFESQQAINKAISWTDLLLTSRQPEIKLVPEEDGDGTGMIDGPGGAIMSRIRVNQGRIMKWDLLDGSTWNVSPRDDSMLKGPMEQALIGTPCEGPEDLNSVYRVFYSFTPCGLSAAH